MRLFKLCTIFDVPRFPLLHAFPFSISVVAFGFWVLNALPFRLVVLCIYRWTHLRYIGVYYVFLLWYMSFRRPKRQKVRPLFILSFVYVFLYQGFPFLAVNPFLWCMCILYKLFFLTFVFPIQLGLDCMPKGLNIGVYRFMFFWWCMSIREYVFVLFLSFCRTTIQKVRPLGMSTRFVVFGLRFRSFWWSMFISEYVFVLLLSFCRTTIQKVRPFAILSLCYRFLKVRPLFILSFVSVFLYQGFPFLVGYLCLWMIFGCEPFFMMHVHSL